MNTARRGSMVPAPLQRRIWHTLEQRRVDSRLTALFKITGGLLSVNSHGLPRPVVLSPTRHSHLKSFIDPASN